MDPTGIQLDLSVKCDCRKVVEDVRSLVQHIILQHGSTTGVHLLCCKQTFSTFRPWNFEEHLRTDHQLGASPLPCTEFACSDTFDSIKKLRRHVRTSCKEKVNKQPGSTKKRVYIKDHASFKRQKIGPEDLSNHHPQKKKEDPLHRTSDLTGAAKEAIQPFLDSVNDLDPVTKIVDGANATNLPDGTTPLHFATKDLLSFDIPKTTSIVMTDMLLNSPAMFSSGHLTQSLPGDDRFLTAHIMSSIACPNPGSNELVYAANIKGSSAKQSPVRVPSLLYKLRPSEVINPYSSNLTPEGTVVDLHRDRMDVFSICTDWKIWVFFPPSSNNLSHMKVNGKHTKRLFCLYKQLENGTFAIIGPGEGVYIPTGYFHATYALTVSCTIGTTWSSEKGLAATTDILVTELYPNAEVPVSAHDDIVCFLQSLVHACHCGNFLECRSAMQRICWRKLHILGKEGPLLGPGWGLKGPKKHAKELSDELRKSVFSSGQARDFWVCESKCSSVLDHICV